MVMGPTHAVSGAAAWLIGSAAAHHLLGVEQSAAAVAVGTIAFPVPIKGKRWYELGLPAPLAIRAGAPIERIVLMPACTLGASIGAVLTLIPEVLQ